MSELHLSDNKTLLMWSLVCMLSYVFALPATHWTCSMAYWHAHMQNTAYCRQSSAAALAQGVPKNTHIGRGIFKCVDNLYGTQYNVVQLGALQKFLLWIFNKRSSSVATDSGIVFGYANYETPAITLNSITLIPMCCRHQNKTGNWPGDIFSIFNGSVTSRLCPLSPQNPVLGRQKWNPRCSFAVEAHLLCHGVMLFGSPWM